MQEKKPNRISRGNISQLRKVEADLESKIEQLYSDCLGHALRTVQCAFLNTLDLYIHMEGTCTPSENFLEEWGSSDLVSRMRQAINQIMKEKINDTLEQDLSVRTDGIRLLKPEIPEQMNVLVSFRL